MEAHSPMSTAPFPQETPRSDVDEILRRKRKAREYKACYPCRQRKVKCDQAVPCKTCIVREHPELCTYHPPAETHPPAKRLSTLTTGQNGHGDIANGVVNHSNGTVTISREDWDRICSKLSTVEKTLSELRSSMRHSSDGFSHHATPASYSSPATTATTTTTTTTTTTAPPLRPAPDSAAAHVRSQGLHTTSDLGGETVHVGGSSVPALVMALGRGDHERPGVQELLGKSILPIFGLDNASATYPFVDLWGLPHGSILRANELCNALPSDTECLTFFRCYKETAHTVYPAVADIDKFETDLTHFLINRAGSASSAEQNSNAVTEQSIYGKSLHWVGLLFGILGSGCQCSALPRKERELTSQVYVCCSFECLRFTNFFSQCTLLGVQTLLILGNVISNNMNAGVAWSLLGLTIRLAQSLGLHRSCPPTTAPAVKALRSRVWWAVIWQDSLLSISYDRASSATTIDHPVPLSPNTGPGTRSYVECMYRLVKVGLDIVRERNTAQNSHDAFMRITEQKNEIQEIMYDAADYLKDSRRCRSMRDQLEHWALYLHVSFITSELCRPAISPSNADHELSRPVRQTCVESLINTVEAFLGLQNVSPYASRSWAAVHRSLSSGLLLGILGEPSRNQRARSLIANLIAVMTEITSKVDPAELSGPITRSIIALQKLVTIQDMKESRPPEDPTVSTPLMTGYSLEDINGALNLTEAFMNHSPLIELDSEASPYAVMDTILWGTKRTPPE